MSFRATTIFSVGIGYSEDNDATCARACTPASVRPEPCGSTLSPVIRFQASANVPCTLGRSGCTCQPLNSEPS